MKRLLCSVFAAVALYFGQDDTKQVAAVAEVGKPVPAFRLNDHTGAAVAIAPDADATEGNWTVLAFYPKAATPG